MRFKWKVYATQKALSSKIAHSPHSPLSRLIKISLSQEFSFSSSLPHPLPTSATAMQCQSQMQKPFMPVASIVYITLTHIHNHTLAYVHISFQLLGDAHFPVCFREFAISRYQQSRQTGSVVRRCDWFALEVALAATEPHRERDRSWCSKRRRRMTTTATHDDANIASWPRSCRFHANDGGRMRKPPNRQNAYTRIQSTYNTSSYALSHTILKHRWLEGWWCLRCE